MCSCMERFYISLYKSKPQYRSMYRYTSQLTMMSMRGGVLALRTLRQRGQTTSVAASGLRMLSTHVSVIGLHLKTDETRLREVFSSYGRLEEAQLVTPDHSSSHLWASLVYSTFDEALEAASEMNGQELDGRLLRVSIIDPPTDDETVPADN